MNMSKYYIRIVVYIWQLIYGGLNWSYTQHEVLGTMYEFMIYI